jgi:hypothetical protein
MRHAPTPFALWAWRTRAGGMSVALEHMFLTYIKETDRSGFDNLVPTPPVP